MNNTCVVCCKESETLCQRCRTPYCSRICQTEDWANHKSFCIPMPPLMTMKKSAFLEKSHTDLNTSLRPPKKLPNQFELSAELGSQKSSLFHNPYKRNSKNIGFNTNSTMPAVKTPLTNETNRKTEKDAQPISEGLNPDVRNIKNDIVVPENALNNEIPLPSAVKVSAAIKQTESILIPVNENKNEASLLPSIEIQRTEIAVMPSLPRMLSTTILIKSQSNDVPSIALKGLSLENAKEEEEVERPKVDHVERSIETMSDIETVPLPPGKRLVCMDCSNISKGYISSCIEDKKAIELIDRLNGKISEYCGHSNDFYIPTTDELCLCEFDEDKKWYRAVVSKVIDSDIFEITFIDFGNVTTVSSKSIRKMPREFMHHCLVNKCYIKGFPDDPTEADIAKLKEFFDNNPIFEVASLEAKNSALYAIELKFSV